MTDWKEASRAAHTTPIKPPSLEDVKNVAQELGFDITGQEELFRDLMIPSLGSFEHLQSIPDFKPTQKFARKPGYEPPPEENKHNAWYIKTDIKGNPHGGILKGKRIALKDTICLGGVRMMNGSTVLEGYIPEVDATVAERILDAGGTIVGKAHCENLCISGGSHTNAKGMVENPRKAGYMSGGSSSGSAVVVASGEADMAIGGDQGGSIRIPASFCGIYGMKPTWGIVPYTGVVGIEHTIDHIGPMTLSTMDNAVLLDAIAGPDGLDARCGPPHYTMSDRGVFSSNPLPAPTTNNYSTDIDSGIKAFKIGIVKEGWRDCEPVVKTAVNAAIEILEDLGAECTEVSIPIHSWGGKIWGGVGVSGSSIKQGFGDTQGSGYRGLYITSLTDYFSENFPVKGNDLTFNAKRFAMISKYIEDKFGNHFYGKSQNLVRKLTFEYDKVLTDYDLLVMPTTPCVATPLPPPNPSPREVLKKAGEGGSNVAQFNLSGHPAMTIPCGKTGDNLPIGIMFVGRKLAEKTIYRASYAFEHAVDWETLVY